MPVSDRRRNIQQIRRQRVASLRARGMTHEEIWFQLASPTLDNGAPNRAYTVDPQTNKPFNRATITRDLQKLEAEWQQTAMKDTHVAVARQLSEIAELKRAAWAKNEYTTVLRCLEREAKLLGLDAPDKLQVSDWRDELIAKIEAGTLSIDDVRNELGHDLAQELFNQVRLRVAVSGEG